MLAYKESSQARNTQQNTHDGNTGKLFLGSSTSPKAQELRARYEKLCMEIQKAKAEVQTPRPQP